MKENYLGGESGENEGKLYRLRMKEKYLAR